MEDLANIRKRLEDKLHELTNRVVDIEGDLRTPNDDDWSEDASESQNDETLQGIESMAVGEIGKIKRALLKIKDGTYGNCEECGERISMKRLEALMYATKCVGCAEPVK